MGFEVEDNKKSRQNKGELWDQYGNHSYTEPIRTNKILKPAPKTKARAGQVSGAGKGQTPGADIRQAKKTAAPAQKSSPMLLCFSLAAIAILISFAFNGISRSNRSVSVETPVFQTDGVRLSTLSSMVPLPEGMRFSSYEMDGLTLKYYLKGKAETDRIDYITSSVFALRIAESANKVTFIEEDTGKEYTFERHS